MYIMQHIPTSLAVLAFSILQTQAASVINDLTFGLSHSVGDSNRNVRGWKVSGSPDYTPEVMSDRIILTPPYPGSKRGAMWTENALKETEWNVDMEFRVNGPERGSGNMQIWYAKEGSNLGAASLYSVEKFDGFVLVIDQHDSHGSVRGFLNDGTKSFNAQHNVDSLVFGQCYFGYRNQGHFTHLRIWHTHDSLDVQIGGQQCFKTQRASIPQSLYKNTY
jgi:lectin, mannose-binding 1